MAAFSWSSLIVVLIQLFLQCTLARAPKDLEVILKLKNQEMENFVGNYEIGSVFETLYRSDNVTCYSPWNADQVGDGPLDLTNPCQIVNAFFVNCSLGLSIGEQAARYNDSRWPMGFDQRPNAEQQKCYCQASYWAYNHGCNSCLKAAGFSSNNDGWIPDEYIDQQSATYCSGNPTVGFVEFLESWVPAKTASLSAYEGPTHPLQLTKPIPLFHFTPPNPAPTFRSGVSLSNFTTQSSRYQSPTSAAPLRSHRAQAHATMTSTARSGISSPISTTQSSQHQSSTTATPPGPHPLQANATMPSTLLQVTQYRSPTGRSLD